MNGDVSHNGEQSGTVKIFYENGEENMKPQRTRSRRLQATQRNTVGEWEMECESLNGKAQSSNECQNNKMQRDCDNGDTLKPGTTEEHGQESDKYTQGLHSSLF